MRFIDINGREHVFELDTSFKIKLEEECRSKSQFKIGVLLSKIFGRNNIFEDYPLPGCANLSWDFWLPHLKIAFEFHGRQHFEYVKFFHETKSGFTAQLSADAKKQKIADVNNIKLIVLQESSFTEWTVDELKKIIGDKL